MPLDDRNPEPGTMLAARYKGQDRTCEVVQTDDCLRYRLDDGTEHKSPSAAGKAVTGGACNGWVFWSLAGEEKPKREPQVKAEKEPAAKKPATAKVAGKKSGKAKAAKKSKGARMASGASYGCGVCPETFTTMKKATAHALTHSS